MLALVARFVACSVALFALSAGTAVADDSATGTLHATATFMGLPWDYTYMETYSGGEVTSAPGAAQATMSVEAGKPFSFAWMMTENSDIYCAGGSSTVSDRTQQYDPWNFIPAYAPRGVGHDPPTARGGITFYVSAHKKWWVDARPRPPCYQYTRAEFTVPGAQTKGLAGCYVMEEPFERDMTNLPGGKLLESIQNSGTLPQVCIEAPLERLVGMNCGIDKFDWYDITLTPMPEKTGRTSCAFLLSNPVVKEALGKAVSASSNVPWTTALSRAILLLKTANPHAQTELQAKIIQVKLKQQSWNYLARAFGVPEAIETISLLSTEFTVGQVVAFGGIPIVAGKALGKIMSHNACVQVNTTVAGGKLYLDWHLVYSASDVKELSKNLDLIEAWAGSRETRALRLDKLHKHALAFRCGPDGLVQKAGIGAEVFSGAKATVTP